MRRREHPCGAILFREVVGTAVPRGQLDPIAPRVVGERFRARETPFRRLSKNIDNPPRCKGDSHFTYGFPKRLDYVSYKVTKRERRFRVRSKALNLIQSEGVMRIMYRSKKLSSHVRYAFFFAFGDSISLW